MGVDRPSVDAAEKEKAGSSFGSHDGRTVSAGEEVLVLGTWSSQDWLRESFLFFEEDVVKASCLCSSGMAAGEIQV